MSSPWQCFVFVKVNQSQLCDTSDARLHLIKSAGTGKPSSMLRYRLDVEDVEFSEVLSVEYVAAHFFFLVNMFLSQ